MNENPLKILTELCLTIIVMGALWGFLATPVKNFLDRTLFRHAPRT